MAWTQDQQRQARELLTRLYPAAKSARRVLSDAGVDPNGFDFDGDARTMWHGVVEALVNADALDAVVGVARQEYPRNPALLELDRARLAASASPTAAPAAGAPSAGATAPPGGTWRVRAEGAVDFRKLTGPQWAALQAALVDAFSFEELRALVRHRFDQNLHAIVSTQNLSTAVYELIQWSQARGWTERLYRAAHAERPDHAALTAFALSSAAPGAGAAAPIADGALERRLRETAPDVKLVDLVRQLGAAQVRVCRVELDGRAEGTGFLVGPAAVMTCHHVVRRVLSGAVAPSAVKVRFDWHPGSDGTPVALAAAWCIHSLPPEDFELFGSTADGEPDERHLDFAVLRLAEPVGARPVAAATPGAAAAPRGWYPLPAARVELTERTPLYVVQHPDGRSMEVALEMEGGARFNAARTRVSHAVNTEAGSSGSPVFTFDGALAALHHSGSSSVVRTRNQAVPIDLIRTELEKFGVLGELEPK